MANRTSRRRDAKEDEVQLRSPVNPDEMLELRAVNDISTAQLATLPAIMARLGASVLLRCCCVRSHSEDQSKQHFDVNGC